MSVSVHPQSVLLPLSLTVMNSWKLTPCKDYTINRLVAGALQLAAGTHLLVDETALEPGRLSEVGVHNLAALAHVIQHQTVTYDFQFHKTEFECDIVSYQRTVGSFQIFTAYCTHTYIHVGTLLYINAPNCALEWLHTTMEGIHYKCKNH